MAISVVYRQNHILHKTKEIIIDTFYFTHISYMYNDKELIDHAHFWCLYLFIEYFFSLLFITILQYIKCIYSHYYLSILIISSPLQHCIDKIYIEIFHGRICDNKSDVLGDYFNKVCATKT